jgi:hypothetical protein
MEAAAADLPHSKRVEYGYLPAWGRVEVESRGDVGGGGRGERGVLTGGGRWSELGARRRTLGGRRRLAWTGEAAREGSRDLGEEQNRRGQTGTQLAVAFDCNLGANAEISRDEAAAGVVRENTAALEKAGRASGSFA